MADSYLSIVTQGLLEPQMHLLTRITGLVKDLDQRTVEAEEKIRQYSLTLSQQTERYEQAKAELEQIQKHLVQSEKLSILGQMVSGIAHEISNPINFIYGNLPYVEEHVGDLLKVLDAYQNPGASTPITEVLEAVDLAFILEDLPRIVDSMKLGADRIRELVLTLRNFYRLDEADMKPADLHEGIEDTLLLLQYRYKQDIEIIRKFGDLPPIECHINQINQVFMNLLGNAIDALTVDETQPLPSAKPKQITILTEVLNPDRVCISISDNGPGISLEVQERLFEPFFTTKPMGLGTGLGLSISYGIITDNHQGKIYCCSAPGAGTTFRVELPVQQTPEEG